MGKDIGAIIFLLFIVGQGVAAVVAALKKRQAKAAKEQAAELSIANKPSDSRVIQADAKSPVQVKAGTPTSTTRPDTIVRPPSGREELIARRRAQIEELKKQARVRRGESSAPTRKAPGTAQPAAPPTRAVQVQRPPVAFRPVQEPEPVPVTPETDETDQTNDVWAITRSRGSSRRGSSIRGAVRSRGRLRDLVVLKEVLDPPLALRSDPFTRR